MAQLLDAPPLKKSSVSRILFDIRRVALFGGIYFAFCLRRVFADLGVVTGTLVASISGGTGGISL